MMPLRFSLANILLVLTIIGCVLSQEQFPQNIIFDETKKLDNGHSPEPGAGHSKLNLRGSNQLAPRQLQSNVRSPKSIMSSGHSLSEKSVINSMHLDSRSQLQERLKQRLLPDNSRQEFTKDEIKFLHTFVSQLPTTTQPINSKSYLTQNIRHRNGPPMVRQQQSTIHSAMLERTANSKSNPMQIDISTVDLAARRYIPPNYNRTRARYTPRPHKYRNNTNSDFFRIFRTPQLYWNFFTYHKSGTIAIQDVIVPIFQELPCNIKHFHFTNPKRAITPALIRVNIVSDHSDINYWTYFHTTSLKVHRSIHVLRDPFDLILSAFLYHSQLPIPEDWLSDPWDFCEGDSNSKHYDIIRNTIKIYQSTEISSMINLWIENIFKECKKQKQKYEKKISYSELMQVLITNTTHPTQKVHDLYPAIRMEAFRSFKQILYMTYHRLQEIPQYVKHFYTEDFSINNQTKYKQTLETMFQYLYEPYHNRNETAKYYNYSSFNELECQMCQCFTIEQIIQKSVEKQFVNYSNEVNSFGPGKHITQHLMSIEDRNHYKQRLLNDPILGNLLKLLANIINSQEDFSRKELIFNHGKLIYNPVNNTWREFNVTTNSSKIINNDRHFNLSYLLKTL